jgi:glycosyltransferase involved in cell wall biosynthesis
MLVKYFYPFGLFYPVQAGNDAVAASHFEYFESRGWSVEFITIRGDSKRNEAAFRARYPFVNSLWVFDLQWASHYFVNRLHDCALLADQAPVRDAFARPADLYLANYVFSTPLTQLLPSGCRRILETIDVMSDQIRLRSTRLHSKQNPAPALVELQRQYLLETELDLYRFYDAKIMISREDLNTVASAGASGAHYVPRYAAQKDPVWTDSNPRYDLLFVGSRWNPNLDGINWFYRNVYVPYLWPRRVRLAVAGRICEWLDFADQHVTLLGTVEGPLDPVYAASKLVIAPVFEGTGLSIKAIEALGMGKALVAAPPAVRGLDLTSGVFVCLDMMADPRRTADAILGLLADPVRRQELERSAAEYARREFGREAFFAGMDRVIQSVGLDPAESNPRLQIGSQNRAHDSLRNHAA